MKDLVIDDNVENEPKVVFSAKNGICTISGHCYPEDAHHFFDELRTWLQDYISDTKGSISFRIKLKYFNSSSARGIYRILTFLKGYKENGGEVEIMWHYDEDDEYMLEEISGYSEEANIAIKKIPKF